MFGLGGIFVEVLKDVSVPRCPGGCRGDAAMLSDINGAPILKGVRGEAPRDTKALADVLVAAIRQRIR